MLTTLTLTLCVDSQSHSNDHELLRALLLKITKINTQMSYNKHLYTVASASELRSVHERSNEPDAVAEALPVYTSRAQ